MTKNPTKLDALPSTVEVPFVPTFTLVIGTDEKSRRTVMAPSKPANHVFIMALLIDCFKVVLKEMSSEQQKEAKEKADKFLGEDNKVQEGTDA